MNWRHIQQLGLISIFSAWVTAMSHTGVKAQEITVEAHIESFQSNVELQTRSGDRRIIRAHDLLGAGEILQTSASARADLRFNDGALARIGELAAFAFYPDTRTFSLTQGTALLLVPPEQGTSSVETPNTTAKVQGAALVVRHVPVGSSGGSSSRVHASQRQISTLGRTVVMVLSGDPDKPVEVDLPNGQTTVLTAGQMAIVDGDELYVFEFDLALFYETSSLVEDLCFENHHNLLDDYDDWRSRQQPDSACQATLENLENPANQRSFVGEYLLDPDFLSQEATTPPSSEWLVPITPGNSRVSQAAIQNKPANANGLLSTKPIPAANDAVESLEPLELAPTTPSEDALTGNADILPPGLIDPVGDSDPAAVVDETPGPETGLPEDLPVENGPPGESPTLLENSPPVEPPSTEPPSTEPPSVEPQPGVATPDIPAPTDEIENSPPSTNSNGL